MSVLLYKLFGCRACKHESECDRKPKDLWFSICLQFEPKDLTRPIRKPCRYNPKIICEEDFEIICPTCGEVCAVVTYYCQEEEFPQSSGCPGGWVSRNPSITYFNCACTCDD